MEQFKKNFQFDLDEDDTIVKDVSDYAPSSKKTQKQNQRIKSQQNSDVILDVDGNPVLSQNDNNIDSEETQDPSENNADIKSSHATNFKTSVCSIFDRCRVCSFKELQQMPECQETGYRLIKRCIKRDQSSAKIIEDRYENQSCELFTGSAQEYQKEQQSSSSSAGQYAEPGTNPYGMGRFMIVMGLFAIIVTAYLNNRKDRILNEIYSKISIVSRN
eukprot:403345573